ncbi:MAG: cobalamin biosynthesis protein CobW [Ruminococcaceae bacterium]|nr:cobalamin biosynthesis protein CobW [Oscillospiraceae bacterium]
MTKIDIFSGFLGAGKTTLIKKLIQEGYQNQKLVLIENEFGEIGIDGGFLQEAGINITEMNSGCICCSLVGDFGKALQEVIEKFAPDRVIIEPSGVGKLSDVVAAVQKVTGHDVELGYTVAVVDAGKVKVYSKNFGEFYNNQIETASTIIMSRTDSAPQAKLDAAIEILRAHNAEATIVTTPWNDLTGVQLIAAMEGVNTKAAELMDEEAHHCCCGHHHHHEDEHEEHHCCGHHHHHEDEHEEHHCCGHHHDHEHEHHHEHHHHEHDEHCICGCHDHDHEHHHHHADEVFTSWGVETAKKFTKEQIDEALHALDSGEYGIVLRAKGIVPATDGTWIHFDMVPEEFSIRSGAADITGKLCVIGSKLDEAGVAALFGV